MDGWTEMTKLVFTLHNCSNMPKNEPFLMTNNGKPEGGSFVGTFERKEVVHLGSFLGPSGY